MPYEKPSLEEARVALSRAVARGQKNMSFESWNEPRARFTADCGEIAVEQGWMTYDGIQDIDSQSAMAVWTFTPKGLKELGGHREEAREN